MTEKILISDFFHGYREAVVTEQEVVWNKITETWSEYIGDEYLEEGDEVVIRKVAD